jgi:hypothetical protein
MLCMPEKARIYRFGIWEAVNLPDVQAVPAVSICASRGTAHLNGSLRMPLQAARRSKITKVRQQFQTIFGTY